MGASNADSLRRNVADAAPPTSMPRPIIGLRAVGIVLFAAIIVAASIWLKP